MRQLEGEDSSKRVKEKCVCMCVCVYVCLLSCFILLNCFLLPGAPWQHGGYEMMDVTFSLFIYLCERECERERDDSKGKAPRRCVRVSLRVLDEVFFFWGYRLRQVPALCVVKFFSFSLLTHSVACDLSDSCFVGRLP